MQHKLVKILDILSNESTVTPVEDASGLTKLLSEEIEWALEEFGECTTDQYIIVEFITPS